MSNPTLGGRGNPPVKKKEVILSLFFITGKQHFNSELDKKLHDLIRPKRVSIISLKEDSLDIFSSTFLME